MKYALIALLFAACAHKPVSTVEHVSGRAPGGAPTLYAHASEELAIGQYATAIEDFDKFNLQNPSSAFYQSALLNSGRALEGLKRWNEASDRYRQMLGGTARAPRLQAMALYRLSVVHEAQGNDTQVVADLIDLLSRGASLPPEIANAEVPARLAAAYARVGNFDKAQEFYKRAETGIARLRQGSAVPEWLPETLRVMGVSHHEVTWDAFETDLRPLARGQIYLMEAAELNHDAAADDLIAQYDAMMSVIEQAPLPAGEPLLARRALQQKQWARVSLLQDALTDLRARKLPDARTTAVKRINDALEKIDHRIATLLDERPAGEGQTPESLARRKQRRAQPSSDSLERAFLKSAKTNPTVAQPPTVVPALPINPSSNGAEPIHASPGDPNL